MDQDSKKLELGAGISFQYDDGAHIRDAAEGWCWLESEHMDALVEWWTKVKAEEEK